MATLATQQLITSLYVAAFGRAPDKGGLTYWSAQMDAGFSYDNVVSSFLSSPEAEVRYGKDVSEQTFLANLYNNILSRPVDEGGAKYWQGRLTELGSRKDVVKEILSSINNSSGSDHQILQNRIDVGLKFAASLSGYDQSYAKSILTYVTADPASVVSAGYLNDVYDHPPVTVPKASLDFYGKSLKFDFYIGSGISSTTTALVSGAVEAQVTGFSFDAGHGSFKITTTFSGSAYYGLANKLVITDVNNSFDSFVGFNVLSNGLVNFTGGAGYNTSNIAVAANSIEIVLTGVNIQAGTSLEFNVLT
jgi:hypothetical protein